MVMETQGNESSGSESVSTGSETTGAASTSSEKMPDDPSLAESGGDEQTAAADKTAPGAAAAQVTKPAYTPNFKYKVLDKEQEFDEWLKAAIKDPETEKKARDLFERAHGLDHVKNDRQRLRTENQQMSSELNDHRQTIGTANHFLKTKDYDNFFNYLKIPEQDILLQAKRILDRRDNPAQASADMTSAQDRQRVHNLESHNQYLTQTYETQAVAARTQELDWTLSRPEYTQAQAAYDARAGRPGAFKEQIIQRGQYHAMTRGVDLSPDQVIQEVLGFLGGMQSLVPPQAAVVAAPVSTQPAAQTKPPVITNIQGRGTSPAKKAVKSIADLKKLALESASANS